MRQKLQRQLEAARQEALRERDLRSDLELSLSAALERSQELQSEAERSIEEVRKSIDGCFIRTETRAKLVVCLTAQCALDECPFFNRLRMQSAIFL